MKTKPVEKLPLYLRVGPYVGPSAFGVGFLDINVFHSHSHWIAWSAIGLGLLWFVWADIEYKRMVESERHDGSMRKGL